MQFFKIKPTICVDLHIQDIYKEIHNIKQMQNNCGYYPLGSERNI